MASSEFRFMFEIEVEELKSPSKATNNRICARFGNVFTLKLKDPHQVVVDALMLRQGGRKTRTLKTHHSRILPKVAPAAQQSVVLLSDVASLIESMLNYPIELTHYSKDEPFILGVAEIPWKSHHIDYLNQLESNPDQPPVVLRETCHSYDHFTSKRVAIMKLKITFSQIKENVAHNTKIIRNYRNESVDIVDIEDTMDNTGTIKTTYRGKNLLDHNRKKHKTEHKSELYPEEKPRKDDEITEKYVDENTDSKLNEQNELVKMEGNGRNEHVISQEEKECVESSVNSKPREDKSILNMVRSQTHVNNTNLYAVTKHWSSTSVEIKERLDTLNYIFGNLDGPFGNRVYCVGYFTVENDRLAVPPGGNKTPTETSSKSPTSTAGVTPSGTTRTSTPAKSPSGTSPPRTSPPGTPGNVPDQPRSDGYSINICDKECVFGGPKNTCFEDVCNFDISKDMASMAKCQAASCIYRRKAIPLTDPLYHERPLIVDFGTSRTTKECCVEKVEEVIGGVSGKLLEDPCLCTCECTFGFIKKTTYCNVCGGFEVPGDEMKSTRGGAPFPCPIYHGLTKSSKKGTGTVTGGKKSSVSDKKSMESDKDAPKTKKKRRRDPRFKFNYGYKGIPPQIGHSQCALPCTGDMSPVPKHMGWLWTANNIPGLKVRPQWKPGAANKHVVRMLRVARYPEEQFSKRKKKDLGKKKRPLKRPLLVVQKKDGEYNITMETMKTFTKPRAVNQYPYEDKPLVQYMVGRTDEENAERKKRKERAQRRLEREQRAFLQSAFHDMCKEICLKTYQQALGVLPFAEDSFCPCYPEEPPPDRIDESHSCSCTESTRSSGSMTDDDEWVVEFTPPNAYFDPTQFIKKIHTAENSTQYTYLDYRVKLVDKLGNPVPRFFTGPDGKEQCSDLGGFWGPNKKWLEINVDGFVGPDARWAPNNFIGPCGEVVDAETGKFQTTNGVWLTVGVDGFVDCGGKWRFYSKPKGKSKDPKLQGNIEAWIKAGKCVKQSEQKAPEVETTQKKGHKQPVFQVRGKKSEATWSCFGDASPRTLSHMGIAGHGHDRRILLSTLEHLLKQGQDVKIPHRPDIPKPQGKYRNRRIRHMDSERIKSKHQRFSSKDITAVNDQGHRTYVQLEYQSPRSKQRLRALDERGISLSSFHVPCFSSFINSEMARKQQLQHILQHNARVMEASAQTTH